MKCFVLYLSLFSLPVFAQVTLDRPVIDITADEVVLVRTHETPEEIKLIRIEEKFETNCIEWGKRLLNGPHESCGTYVDIYNTCNDQVRNDERICPSGWQTEARTRNKSCLHEVRYCEKEEKVSLGFRQ